MPGFDGKPTREDYEKDIQSIIAFTFLLMAAYGALYAIGWLLDLIF